MKNTNNLYQTYQSLRLKYPNIVEIGKITIQEFEKKHREYFEIPEFSANIFSIITAVLFLVFYPLLISLFFSISKDLSAQLISIINLQSFSLTHKEIFLSYGLCLLSIPVYTIFPLLGRNKKFPKLNTLKKQRNIAGKKSKEESFPFTIADKNLKGFIVFTVCINYVNAWIFISLILTATTFSRNILQIGIISLLMIPFAILSLLPFILLIFFFVIIFSSRQEIERGKKQPSIIIVKLIETLSFLDTQDKDEFIDFSKRVTIFERIETICFYFDNYLSTLKDNDVGNLVNKNFKEISLSFKSLEKKILFPESYILSDLILEIIPYLNAFLSNDFRLFPKTSPMEIEQNSVHNWKNNRLFILVFGILYMVLPILIIGLVIKVTDFEVGSIIQSMISILYAAWIIFGFLNFSGKLQPEFRSLVLEIVKTLLPK
ncbi:hypothetical protein SDC9_54356 [bioreactor metagenome]|uniref:Uncharacterized protein n=1 Tax=bioreactor metagenome TaxID=1076179 RepID=A0A644X1K1_9ZZZZ